MSREMMIPGPDHQIEVTPSEARVLVKSGDTVIADTNSSLVLSEASYPPVYYVPIEDVDQSLLEKTDTQTYCPFKGDASYYKVKARDRVIDDAIWTYETPYPSVSEIAGHVAFYPDRVALTVTDN